MVKILTQIPVFSGKTPMTVILKLKLTIDPWNNFNSMPLYFLIIPTRSLEMLIISGSSDDLIFDKGTYTTTLTTTNPSQNQTITFPDASGTVALTSQLGGGGGSGVPQEDGIFVIVLG